jgi:hypothetical protein
MAVWHGLMSFGIFSRFGMFGGKKNLATLRLNLTCVKMQIVGSTKRIFFGAKFFASKFRFFVAAKRGR